MAARHAMRVARRAIRRSGLRPRCERNDHRRLLLFVGPNDPTDPDRVNVASRCSSSIEPAVCGLLPHRRRTSIEPRRVSAQSPKSSSSRRPSRTVTRSCPLDPGPGTLDGQARFFVSNRIRVGSAPSALSISLAPPSPRAVRTISMCSVPGSPIPNRWADLRAALAVGENGSCPSGGEPWPTPRRARTISRTG